MSLSTLSKQQDLAGVFAALGDERRLKIIEQLMDSDGLTVSGLCDGADVSRQAISKHIKTLSNAKLVLVEKSGREMRCRLNPERMLAAVDFLEMVETKWDQALVRLKKQVE